MEGKETSNDYSYEWVQGNSDLKAIERGIRLTQFSDEMSKRDLEMEFRVRL